MSLNMCIHIQYEYMYTLLLKHNIYVFVSITYAVCLNIYLNTVYIYTLNSNICINQYL